MRRYLPSYDTCFACGKKNPNGLRLSLYVENGQVGAEFNPRKELCGFSGILHGGIISVVLDEALWWSSAIASGRLVVTQGLTVNYLKSITIRKTYRVQAHPAQPKSRLYVCSGRIVDKTGAVYAEGKGTYVPLRWGKNRDPQKMLSYVDERGNQLPEDRIYWFEMREGNDTLEHGGT